MADRDVAELLEDVLGGSVSTDAELTELAAIAAVLQTMPDNTFRTRLRTDLERTITMTTTDDAIAGSPTRMSGISYMHIPTRDARESADFYTHVFDWTLRGTPESPSFSDGTGDVIGAWDTDLTPAGNGGVLPYVFVASVDETLVRAASHGGEVVREPYPEGEGDAPLWVATFRDPTGNVIGIWQLSPRTP